MNICFYIGINTKKNYIKKISTSYSPFRAFLKPWIEFNTEPMKSTRFFFRNT